jgi:hypothetical protein
MSRVRGSLFAANAHILLRSSGGSLGKTVNLPLVVSMVGRWFRATRCKMIGVCGCCCCPGMELTTQQLLVTWRGRELTSRVSDDRTRQDSDD